MAVARGGQLQAALQGLRAALIAWDRRTDGHRLAPQNVAPGPCQGRPVRWKCTYQGLAGASGRADFDCVEAATRFADLHANRTGVPARSEWERSGDAWILSTQLGQYIVRPINSPTE